MLVIYMNVSLMYRPWWLFKNIPRILPNCFTRSWELVITTLCVSAHMLGISQNIHSLAMIVHLELVKENVWEKGPVLTFFISATLTRYFVAGVRDWRLCDSWDERGIRAGIPKPLGPLSVTVANDHVLTIKRRTQLLPLSYSWRFCDWV